MAKEKGKRIREKGKVKLSEYFKEIKEGERVSVDIDVSFKNNIPKRIQGLSGEVEGSRGEFKVVKINDGDKIKRFIIHPVHLRRL